MQDGTYNVERMKADMVARGWLRTDLAKRAKVSDMAIYRFFEGHHRTARMAKKIARALGHELNRYLLDGAAA